MEKNCENCIFETVQGYDAPCKSCKILYPRNIDATDNFQPRPKRKELEAQLSTANAELESMHRELAAAYAVLREIKDIFVGESLAVFFAKTIKSIDDYLSGKEKYSGVYDELAAKDAEIAEWKRIHAILKKDQLALYKNRTHIIEDLNAKQAIINEQKCELDEAKYRAAWWEAEHYTKNGWVEIYCRELADKKAIIELLEKERDEALAECTELAKALEGWKNLHDSAERWAELYFKQREEARQVARKYYNKSKRCFYGRKTEMEYRTECIRVVLPKGKWTIEGLKWIESGIDDTLLTFGLMRFATTDSPDAKTLHYYQGAQTLPLDGKDAEK